MKPEEAIEYLKERIDYLKKFECPDLVKAYESAIQALEKQVVQKDLINMFLGQSGECDGYLACAVKNHDGRFEIVGEVMGSYEEFVDWCESELTYQEGELT